MRKPALACVLALLAGLAMPGVHANEVAPNASAPESSIERELAACIERDPSTAGMTQCVYAANDAWDTSMNAGYARLLASLSPPEAEALRASQRRWLVFRDAEYVLIDAVFARLDGTMWIPMRVGHRLSLTQARARQLEQYQALVDETCEQGETPPECDASTSLEDVLPTLDPLDREFAECFFGDATTSVQVECAYRAGEAWDARLNSNYTRLRTELPDADRDVLRGAQRRWIEFRDAEFEALDAIHRTKQGTMYYPLRVQARYEVVRARAMELDVYRSLGEHSGD